ncbi:MAG: antibiotic biosynthesis monooxygenase family protein [Tepidisphaeraceae bacterium]
MIDTFITFGVFAGRTGEFETTHRRLLAHMCGKPGCVDVSVHRSTAEPLEYMVHGRWESKDAWERAHQIRSEFRGLFAQLPLEAHSLTRASFFEPAYGFTGGKADPLGH